MIETITGGSRWNGDPINPLLAQNDREKGPNNYVTDLRVLVSRHRSLSASAALAVCWNFSSDFTKFPGNGRTRSKMRAASGLAVV